MPTKAPSTSLDTLAEWGSANLRRVIAIDSQSDAASSTLPSTEGQRRLSDDLRGFFEDLGWACEQDPSANLIAQLAATADRAEAPPLALMVHMDTSEGTRATAALVDVPAWDGGPLRFPANPSMVVSAEHYPSLCAFLGEDLIHGPGDAPIGLDDKLGMAELMTLAQLLDAEPTLPHGPLTLVFRPDEEIGRMEAVEGLAALLAERGVHHGYTVDGIDPFEVNVENFHAAAVEVHLDGRPLPPAPGLRVRELSLDLRGVKSHGATAKAEGYANATVLLLRALDVIRGAEVIPVGFCTDPAEEIRARVTLLLRAADTAGLDTLERALMDALRAEVEPRTWQGASVRVLSRRDAPSLPWTDAVPRLLDQLRTFLSAPGPTPVLSEDSAGRQGYSNPHALVEDGVGFTLHYRLRDFDEAALASRARHIREAAAADPEQRVRVVPQYRNLGPELARYPELVRWARAALAPLGVDREPTPIRGGTGVDPFLSRGVGVANLGTGYFAPESEKELTSRQSLARHALWLAHLVQVVAA